MLDIKSLDIGPSGGHIKFVKDPQINIDNLMRTIATNSREYRFTGAESVQITRQMESEIDRINLANDFFDIIKE